MFVFGVVLAGVCLLASIFAWGMAARAESEAKSVHVTGSGQPATSTATTTLMVHLSEFQIDPAVIHASVGERLQAMNIGSMAHNLAVDTTSLATPMIKPGGRAHLGRSGAGHLHPLPRGSRPPRRGQAPQVIVSASASQAASTP
jgi:plastocyanin